MNETSPPAIRRAIIEALPTETSLHGGIPEQREVYVPPFHAKALRLECYLVIGARGVGKSFWSAALRSEAIRKMLGNMVRKSHSRDYSLRILGQDCRLGKK